MHQRRTTAQERNDKESEHKNKDALKIRPKPQSQYKEMATVRENTRRRTGGLDAIIQPHLQENFQQMNKHQKPSWNFSPNSTPKCILVDF